jgi:uncharacterized membrane protein
MNITWYQLFLFFHISSVVVWLGAGTTLAVLSQRVPIGEIAEWLGPRLFAPASLGTLAFGIALVLNGSWTFSPTWVQLGLAGFALSFVLNFAVRFPLLRRLESDPAGVGRKLAWLGRAEALLLFAVVLDMVVKP